MEVFVKAKNKYISQVCGGDYFAGNIKICRQFS
jgi:hypothetical protein